MKITTKYLFLMVEKFSNADNFTVRKKIFYQNHYFTLDFGKYRKYNQKVLL